LIAAARRSVLDQPDRRSGPQDHRGKL